MKTVAIALFMEQKEINKKYVPILTGVRLIDAVTYEVADFAVESVIQAIKDKKIYVQNIRLNKGELKGYNGELTRLPMIFPNFINNEKVVTIIRRTKEIDSYVVSNYKGEIAYTNKDALFNMGKAFGISNGKAVEVEEADRENYISSIKGQY